MRKIMVAAEIAIACAVVSLSASASTVTNITVHYGVKLTRDTPHETRIFQSFPRFQPPDATKSDRSTAKRLFPDGG